MRWVCKHLCSLRGFHPIDCHSPLKSSFQMLLASHSTKAISFSFFNFYGFQKQSFRISGAARFSVILGCAPSVAGLGFSLIVFFPITTRLSRASRASRQSLLKQNSRGFSWVGKHEACFATLGACEHALLGKHSLRDFAASSGPLCARKPGKQVSAENS